MFAFSTLSKPNVGPTQPPTKNTMFSFPGDNAARAWGPFTCSLFRNWSYTSTTPHSLMAANIDKYTVIIGLLSHHIS